MDKMKHTATLIGSGLLTLCLAGSMMMGWGTHAQAAEGNYYAPITATEGDELLGQLHDLITETHTKYTTYGECRDHLPVTDHAEGGEKSIIEFFTHETIIEYTLTGGDAGRWNREHVWPKANSNNLWKSIKNNESGGGADLHHIRPTEVKMNSDHENDRYGEVSNGSPIYSKTVSGANSQIGGYHAGGVFEPLDNVKGDVARIVLYVYTHYNTYSNVNGTTNGSGNSSYFGTLPITNIIAASDEDAAFELLIEWNELDEVDEIETHRNEEVFKIQGNRNPFIDHPEYVDAIWGDGTELPPDVGPGEEPGGEEPGGEEPGGEDPGTDPGSETPGTAPAEGNKGCGGAIGSGAAAIVLGAAAAVVLRRRS